MAGTLNADGPVEGRMIYIAMAKAARNGIESAKV